jgi:hypothetical protein
MTMRIHFYRMLTLATLLFALGSMLVFVPMPRCEAQAKDEAESGAQTTIAALHEPPAKGTQPPQIQIYLRRLRSSLPPCRRRSSSSRLS